MLNICQKGYTITSYYIEWRIYIKKNKEIKIWLFILVQITKNIPHVKLDSDLEPPGR